MKATTKRVVGICAALLSLILITLTLIIQIQNHDFALETKRDVILGLSIFAVFIVLYLVGILRSSRKMVKVGYHACWILLTLECVVLFLQLAQLGKGLPGALAALIVIIIRYIPAFVLIPFLWIGLRGVATQFPEDKGVNVDAIQQKPKYLKISCPQCGRLLKGATQAMIGDIGVCPKCKTEFVIEQKE